MVTFGDLPDGSEVESIEDAKVDDPEMPAVVAQMTLDRSFDGLEDTTSAAWTEFKVQFEQDIAEALRKQQPDGPACKCELLSAKAGSVICEFSISSESATEDQVSIHCHPKHPDSEANDARCGECCTKQNGSKKYP